jgi:hypothetical protein
MKKIKSFLPLFLCLAIFGTAYAIDSTKSRIQNVEVPSCVSVSTSTWTAVPALASIPAIGKGGQIISSHASNSASFGIVLSSVSTVSVSTMTAIMEVAPGEAYVIDNSLNVKVFAVSYHTSAESMCQQQFKLDYP